MKKTIGIAGAGLMGRMMTLELSKRGWDVTLFDQGYMSGEGSCSYVGAGMLSPICELITAERKIAEVGLHPLANWPPFLESLSRSVFFQQEGSLVVAHPKDREELDRLYKRASAIDPDVLREVSGKEIDALESDLKGRFIHGLYIPNEAQVDNRGLLKALGEAIMGRDIPWHEKTRVEKIQARKIATENETFTFDWTIDCRGLGAKNELEDLRGVRGELIIVDAPKVHLNRPIRMMHPRYTIYIVPRENNRYIIGATQIESEDHRPITVRSALELLSAAYAVHPGFAEATLFETLTACRPAFPDNQPRIYYSDGLLRINGLYRHGFLLSPALANFAANYLETDEIPQEISNWFVGF